jgi:hypothetical protein
MAETYCGKSCADCTQKEQLNCPGCKIGPGRSIGGECDIARCVRSKGHSTCSSCVFAGNCSTQRLRSETPAILRRKRAEERAMKEALAKRVPFFGKWFLVLFLLFIPNIISGIMTADVVKEIIPELFVLGQILGVVCNIGYAVILLIMSREEAYYSAAGLCGIVVCCMDALLTYFLSWPEPPVWALLLTLVFEGVGIYGIYSEFQGHASVLRDVNIELSEKWITLWRWYLGLMIGFLVSFVLGIPIPLFGIFGVFISLIGVLVVGIFRLVYLWQSADFLRNYSVE